MPPWLCSQSKELFHSSRTAYQRALPTVSPAGLMVLAILSTLIFVPHSHHRDKWFDRCTGTAWGILMDTIFIRGFVSSRCKHTLCTRWFPCRPSAQIRPNTRSWWFTSESYPSSSANWIRLRLRCRLRHVNSLTGPESLLSSLQMTFLRFWTILFITTSHAGEWGWFRRIHAGARRQPEHVIESCVEWKGWRVGKLNLISRYKCAASVLTVAAIRPLLREQEGSKKTTAVPIRGPHSRLAN